jgi:hypothetical protein
MCCSNIIEFMSSICCVGKRVIGMHDQFSKIPTSTLTLPFRQWCQHFAHIIARVEFAPTFEGSHDCESRRTAHDSEHHFCGLNGLRFPIRNFSIRRESYEFMIWNVVEPGLIQCHDVVRGSGLSFPQCRKKGLWTLDLCCFLSLREEMRLSSEMMRSEPEFLSESPIYGSFG